MGGVYRIQTFFGFLYIFYIYKAPYPIRCLDDIVVLPQYQMSRLEQEMDHLRQQNEWLEGELGDKTNDLLTVRKEKVRVVDI